MTGLEVSFAAPRLRTWTAWTHGWRRGLPSFAAPQLHAAVFDARTLASW